VTRLPIGVTPLDHTADVGLEVSAPDLAELLRRAVRGLAWLLLERDLPAASGERMVRVRAGSPALLLRELLREISWWNDAEGLVVVDLGDVRVRENPEASELSARALVAQGPGAPVREIKGVTLHGLVAEEQGDGWYGRVIFDV
jgi:SHS2 domain-containing protein